MATALETGRMTSADDLRASLALAEKRIVALDDDGGPAELFRLLDEIALLMVGLTADGVDLRAEQTRWESLQAQVSGRARAILRAWKRRGGLAAARAQVSPPVENWWWRLDSEASAQQRRRMGRLVVGAVAAVALLALAAAAFRLAFPVDPAVRDLYRLHLRAEEALQRGDPAAALAAYRDAVSRAPADVESQIMVGVLAESLGEADLADQSFAAARALTAGEGEFVVERGFGYLRAGLADKANADGQQAVALKPDDGRGWMLLGGAREALGDAAGAVDAYSQVAAVAAETDPQLVVLARVRMAAILQTIQAVQETAPAP